MELIGPGSVLSLMMGDPLGAAGGGQVRGRHSGKNGPGVGVSAPGPGHAHLQLLREVCLSWRPPHIGHGSQEQKVLLGAVG